MLQVVRKSSIPSEKKIICVSPGRFTFDAWYLQDFRSCQDKWNHRSSEGDPPLKSIISAFLKLCGQLSSSSLVRCRAGGFGASCWRARKTLQLQTWMLLFQNTNINSRRLCTCMMSLWGWKWLDLPIPDQTHLVPKTQQRVRSKPPGTTWGSMWDFQSSAQFFQPGCPSS